VLWGIGYFVLLVIEKYVPFMKNIGKHWYGHVYSLFFVIILWIFFRADNLSVAFRYITMLFDFRSIGIVESEMCTFMPFLTIAISLCLPWGKWFERFEWLEQKKVFGVMKGVASVLLAFMSICAVINSSYTPYIYGKF
jgi:hypothetical protein